MAATEPIRDKQSIRKLAQYYLDRGNYRNYVLIVMSLHTALRISDLLQLTWDTLYDSHKNRVRSEIYLVEKKTGKSKLIALNKNIIHAISIYASKTSIHGQYIFENPRTGKPISRI